MCFWLDSLKSSKNNPVLPQNDILRYLGGPPYYSYTVIGLILLTFLFTY